MAIGTKFRKALLGAVFAAASLAVAAGAQAQQAPFKIGGVLCTSGPFAAVGIDEMRGAQLAVKQINAAGGVDGRKLELIVEDDQGRTDLSVIRANKLLSQDNVSAMIACYGAGAVAYSGTLQKAKVPLFGIIGSAALTQLGNPYIFRTALGDPTIMEGIMDIMQKRGRKRVAIVHQSDTMGTGAAQALAAGAKKHGFDIVAAESFAVQSDLDLTAQITRIRAQNPDAVVIWAGSPQSIAALKALQLLGMTEMQVYGAPAMTASSVIEVAAKSAEGSVVLPDVISRGTPIPEQAAFAEEFKKEFGAPPNTSYAMAGRDSIGLIAQALKGTGGNGAKVMANGQKITNYKGLMGTYTYTATNREGLTASSIRWQTVRGGKLGPL